MSLQDNKKQRQKMLQELYNYREAQPQKGWVTEYTLRETIGFNEFALVILKELGQINKDGNRYRITGQGVLAAEQSPSR